MTVGSVYTWGNSTFPDVQELFTPMFDRFLEFATHHPLLVGAFVVVLLVWALYEARRSGANAVSSSEATHLINREDAQIVDLREAKEFKAGYIAGAINIPNGKLDSRINELEKFKDRPVILVCKAGQQASAAALKLEKAGFSKVKRLRGGMAQWQADDLPTVNTSKKK